MKRCLLVSLISSMVAAGTVGQAKQPPPEVPGNFFIFSENAYVAHAGVPSVELRVYFAPGDPRYSGWVDYSTRDGTALAGVDYLPVEGRLYFSGENEQSFRVPILSDGSGNHPKRFEVVLSNPEALIWDDPATVVLQSAPRLEWADAGTFLEISWPATYKDYVLEQSVSSDFSTPIELAPSPALRGNRWQVEQPRGLQPHRFYRLRKNPAGELP